jgi:ABC-type dipeptide/oligopeptide/nickel transport system permease component
MGGMFEYVARRLVMIVPILLVLSFFVFFIFFVLFPGDLAEQIAGDIATPEQVEAIRKSYGLDKPYYVQYGLWLWRLLHGDLGESWYRGQPVIDLILPRIPITLGLTVSAFVISIIMGISLGAVAALKHGGPGDYAATATALFGLSMPNFWLGLMLILVFSVALGWIPLPGAGQPITPLTFLLPAIALGTSHAGTMARLTRSSMLEVMREDYVRTARAKGLKERVVIWKHAFRNALIPIITLMALRLPWLFAGTVVLESIFVLPGMGRLIFESTVITRDYLVVQASVLMFVVFVTLANLLADILYAYVNPKIRYR